MTADDAAMGVGDGARSAAIAGGDESLALLARARDDAPDVERGDATTRQHPERRRGWLRATTTWATHPIVVATMLTLGVCGMAAREDAAGETERRGGVRARGARDLARERGAGGEANDFRAQPKGVGGGWVGDAAVDGG